MISKSFDSGETRLTRHHFKGKNLLAEEHHLPTQLRQPTLQRNLYFKSEEKKQSETK